MREGEGRGRRFWGGGEDSIKWAQAVPLTSDSSDFPTHLHSFAQLHPTNAVEELVFAIKYI